MISWKRKSAALVLAGGMALSGCTAGQDQLSREDKLAIGAVAGAVIGGLVGYEYFGGGNSRLLWAAALGAAGAYGGQMLADRLTKFDRTAMQETAYNTLSDGPTGETAHWENNNTGTHGSITPLRTYLDSQGRICRDYNATVSVGGDELDGRETACLTEAGHWVVFATTG